MGTTTSAAFGSFSYNSGGVSDRGRQYSILASGVAETFSSSCFRNSLTRTLLRYYYVGR